LGEVKGLHHITLVTRNQKVNSRFYTEILGLRRVKMSVNQDDIYHRHLFYADHEGNPGSTITFFEWPELSPGRVGLTSPHHISYEVKKIESIIRWKKWLASKGVSVRGPFVRDGRISLYLRDPDGVLIEITRKDSERVEPKYILELEEKIKEPDRVDSDMILQKLDHSSPVASDSDLLEKFFTKVLGLKKNYFTKNPDQDDSLIVGIGNEQRNDFMRYIVSDKAPYGIVGIGNIHHIAMMVEEDQDQRHIMRKLEDLGIRNSGIIDRFWFKSLYLRDPEGNLLEIATKGPGYTTDETPERLGTSLVLPYWLEPKRVEIERALKEMDLSNPARWPPAYLDVPFKPESFEP
jgi:glyoxalase family protein